MSEEIRFSIVLPTYNVKPYLADALGDIAAQKYRNFEVILVEDCSTDGSRELAMEWAQKYAWLTVLSQKENSGVSVARNTGLKEATGDYILFLDPDDRYEKTLLSVVAQSLRTHPADVLVYSLYEDYYDDEKIIYTKTHSIPTVYTEKKEEMAHLFVQLEKETMYGYPWNKAYRLAYLREHEFEFPIISHVEDILFNISVCDKLRSLTVIEDKLYHYRNQRQTGKRLTDKVLVDYFALQKMRIEAFLKQQDMYHNHSKEVYEVMAAMYFRSFVSAMEQMMRQKIPTKEIKKMVQTERKTDLYYCLKDHLSSEGKVAKILYTPLAKGHIFTSIFLTRIISFVRTKMPNVFARWKQNR